MIDLQSIFTARQNHGSKQEREHYLLQNVGLFIIDAKINSYTKSIIESALFEDVLKEISEDFSNSPLYFEAKNILALAHMTRQSDGDLEQAANIRRPYIQDQKILSGTPALQLEFNRLHLSELRNGHKQSPDNQKLLIELAQNTENLATLLDQQMKSGAAQSLDVQKTGFLAFKEITSARVYLTQFGYEYDSAQLLKDYQKIAQTGHFQNGIGEAYAVATVLEYASQIRNEDLADLAYKSLQSWSGTFAEDNVSTALILRALLPYAALKNQKTGPDNLQYIDIAALASAKAKQLSNQTGMTAEAGKIQAHLNAGFERQIIGDRQTDLKPEAKDNRQIISAVMPALL